MKDRRIVLLLALSAAAGLSVLVSRFRLDTARRAEHAAQLSLKGAALAAQTLQLQHRLGEIEAKRLARSAALATSAKEQAPNKTTTNASQPSWLELLRTDPIVQSRYLAYQRSKVKMEYKPLLTALALTPEQVAKFEQNLAENRANMLDLRSALAAKGLPADDSAVQAFQRQQQADYENAQREVLGQAGFDRWKAYEDTSFAREVVRTAAGAATLAGLTLTAEQVRQLTALVAEATKAAPGEFGRLSTGIDWAHLDDESRSFLRAEQVEFIKNTEVIGPLGMGTRYQNRLNDLITSADHSDQVAKRTSR
jgi:hypothetical protein